jgi:hypothetical protein
MLLPLRAIAYALAVFCILELFQIPLASYTSHPTNLLTVALLSFSHVLAFVAPQLAAAIAWNQLLHHPGWGSVSKRRLVSLALAGAAIVPAYGALAFEPAIARHPPLIAIYVGLLLATTGGLWVLDPRIAERLPLPKALRSLAPKIVIGSGVVGGVALYFANFYVEPGEHEVFHLSLAQLSFVVLAVGLSGVHAPREESVQGSKIAAGLAFMAMLPPLVLLTPLSDLARPRFINDTVLGQSRHLYGLDLEETEGAKAGSRTRVNRQEARRLFEDHSGLPRLPVGFSITDYNVLLLTIECTRLDKTSLGDATLNTTPNLLAWRDQDGVMDFRRAYSPSSGTLHSMGSIVAMAPPSAVPMATWRLNWRGELFPEVNTVAEQLYAVGYETIWIGHNHNACFDDYILGFGQGFETRELIPASETDEHLDADAKIADALSASFRDLAERKSRFFLWSSLDSPHAHYFAHYDDWPQETKYERYLQELRYADEQVGRILAALDETGLSQNTIVILTADHGEEFEEHGGTLHKATLYSEVTHVPLLVRIPGVEGGSFEHPTNLNYLFPWLFLNGPEPLQRMSENALMTLFGPLMKATDGAVLLELIGPGRMKSSLVYPRYKINYDFQSKLHELYDVRNDPLEQEDLFESEPEKAEHYVERMSAYRKWRRMARRYEIIRDKLDALPIDLQVNSRF